MDGKLGVALLIVLIVNVVVMVAGFGYLQGEINSLKPSAPTPTVTASTPPYMTESPTQSPTALPSTAPAPSSAAYSNVVFEWYLKPEFKNNQTWLESAMHGDYNPDKTWKQNYVQYIGSFWEIPQGLVDSEMGVLAKAAFIRNVPVDTVYDEASGYTKTTY